MKTKVKAMSDKLKVQDEYLLFRRDEIKTKVGGLQVPEEYAKKQDAGLPIGVLVAKGPNSKVDVEVGKYVMYDVGQCRAAFDYQARTYIIGLPTAILLEVESPDGFKRSN